MPSPDSPQATCETPSEEEIPGQEDLEQDAPGQDAPGRDSFFQDCLEELYSIEGGYSDHPNDSGGRTRFGITERDARESGWTGSMRTLPRMRARAIYHEKYWRGSGADRLSALAPQSAFELFEYSVNAGEGRAVIDFQDLLNALNRGGKDFDEIAEDGVYGGETHGAVEALLHARPGKGGLHVLNHGLDGMQFSHYKRLQERRPAKYEAFFFGWVARRVGTDVYVD